MITITQVWKHYIEEHCREAGVDAYRVRQMAKKFIGFFGPACRMNEIDKARQYEYVDARLKEGVKEPTIRKELTIFFAAIRYAIKEERLDKFKFIQMVKGSEPKRVYLDDEQIALVYAQKMSERMYRFYRIAFAAAARARAIEELQVGRVDFARNVMDFRVPGVNYKNKRRGEVPIAADLLEDLKRWCEGRAPEEYVIGHGARGPRPDGTPTQTYHESQRVMLAAGLWKKGFPPRHVCRKTWASQAVQSGIQAKEMETVLHDRAKTIDDNYAFLKPDHAQTIINFKKNVVPAREAQ